MKKFNVKSFIIGVIISTVLTGIIFPSFANTKDVSVFYDNIKLLINGKIIPVDQEPFILNGRTFVPVRFVAEAFDKDVIFNNVTKTVEINDKPSTRTGISRLVEHPELLDNTSRWFYDREEYGNFKPITTIDYKLRDMSLTTKDGVKYLNTIMFENIYVGGYRFGYDAKSQTSMLIVDHDGWGNKVLLDNIPTIFLNEYIGTNPYIDFIYFNMEILPLLVISPDVEVIR
jgi:hypothetical protein